LGIQRGPYDRERRFSLFRSLAAFSCIYTGREGPPSLYSCGSLPNGGGSG
jgi:hypothetical protein